MALGSSTYELIAKISADTKQLNSGMKSAIGGVKSFASKLVAIGGAIGLGKVIGDSLTEGGALEQSLGGVETLFGKSADVVKANAKKAFSTSGLSANDYMQNVTSFSASLLQSLGGDTQKAAKVADMAMVDMSDNANKMGTSMESIQNAYQGFAKQNYTMLDNLKLGYGGTKSEMERLLADATKLTGVKYDIQNLSDVYEAVHAIQDNLKITGTTALEASETLEGSAKAMKGAFSNLLGNMALGENIDKELQDLASTTSTWLFGNFLPMVANVMGSLPTVIGEAIEQASPIIKTKVVSMMANAFGPEATAKIWNLGKAIITSMQDVLAKVQPVFTALDTALAPFKNTLMTMAGQLPGLFDTVAGAIGGVLDTITEGIGKIDFQPIATLYENHIPTLQSVVGGLGGLFQQVFGALPGLINAIIPVISTVGGMFQTIFGALPQLFTVIGDTFQEIVTIISNGISSLDFSGLQALADAIIPALTSGFKRFWEIVKPAFEGLVEAFTNLWNAIQPVLQILADALMPIFEVLASFVGGIVAGVFSKLGGIMNIFAGVIKFLTPVIKFLIDVFKKIAPVLQTVGEWVGKAIGLFGNLGGSATTLWGYIKSAWGNIKTAIKFAWDGIKLAVNGIKSLWSGLQTAGGTLKNVLTTAWNGIKSVISTVKNAISGFIDGIKTFFSNLGKAGDTLKTGISDAWNAMVKVVEGAKTSISGIIDGIKGFFTSLGDIDLFGIGKKIIDGFLGGIKDVWDKGKKVISNIGGWIKDHKGPVRKDKRLLIPAGKAIMTGFNKGIETNFKYVKRTVLGIAGQVDKLMDTAVSDRTMNIGVNSKGINTSNLDDLANRGINTSIGHEFGFNGENIAVDNMQMHATLVLGGQEYEAYIDNISETQDKQYQLKMAYQGG